MVLLSNPSCSNSPHLAELETGTTGRPWLLLHSAHGLQVLLRSQPVVLPDEYKDFIQTIDLLFPFVRTSHIDLTVVWFLATHRIMYQLHQRPRNVGYTHICFSLRKSHERKLGLEE